jgi:hypothetical protein
MNIPTHQIIMPPLITNKIFSLKNQSQTKQPFNNINNNNNKITLKLRVNKR